jgi:2-isopropylmalate synthase
VAALSGIGVDLWAPDDAEQALFADDDATAAASVNREIGDRLLGVGIDANIVVASRKAVVSTLNQAACKDG